MKDARIDRLLDRAAVIRHACDLDLLVFLARHPRALLTSERLAVWLGYEIKRVADSLESFIETGLLQRTQNSMHAARLFVLNPNAPSGGGLGSLIRAASTREGRIAVLAALSRRSPAAPGPSVQDRHAGRSSAARVEQANILVLNPARRGRRASS